MKKFGIRKNTGKKSGKILVRTKKKGPHLILVEKIRKKTQNPKKILWKIWKNTQNPEKYTKSGKIHKIRKNTQNPEKYTKSGKIDKILKNTGET